jgi:hypothetical protein
MEQGTREMEGGHQMLENQKESQSTCATCHSAHQKQGIGLYCDEVDEAVKPDEYCDDWQEKHRTGALTGTEGTESGQPTEPISEPEPSTPPPDNATCGDCAWRMIDTRTSTGFRCDDDDAEVGMDTTACRNWEWREEGEGEDGTATNKAGVTQTQEETPQPLATAAFNLYRLPGFQEQLDLALESVYDYLSDGPSGNPSIKIMLKFISGIVRPVITVSLPNDIKLKMHETTYIRENGAIRMEVAKQADLFET